MNRHWLPGIVLIAALLALGGCAGQARAPQPPPVVLSQAAWQQIDREIVDASHGAVGSAQDYARRSMRVWRERVQARTEADFIPWFTGYWAASILRFESGLYTGQATLLATPEGLRGLRALSSAVARAVAAAPPSRRKDGRTAVTIPIESVEHACGQLMHT